MSNDLFDARIENHATNGGTASELPIAITGAGPVGLVAAAQLAERKIPFVIRESGSQGGHSALAKDHVQATGCCGGPAPAGADACCVKDADAKAAGLNGCGCGISAVAAVQPVTAGGGCCG
jgi:hypothetical protein